MNFMKQTPDSRFISFNIFSFMFISYNNSEFMNWFMKMGALYLDIYIRSTYKVGGGQTAFCDSTSRIHCCKETAIDS
jgi:hypothetical protein